MKAKGIGGQPEGRWVYVRLDSMVLRLERAPESLGGLLDTQEAGLCVLISHLGDRA